MGAVEDESAIGTVLAEALASMINRQKKENGVELDSANPPLTGACSCRLGFCASYGKIKYRAINTYILYVPTIRDLAE